MHSSPGPLASLDAREQDSDEAARLGACLPQLARALAHTPWLHAMQSGRQ